MFKWLKGIFKSSDEKLQLANKLSKPANRKHERKCNNCKPILYVTPYVGVKALNISTGSANTAVGVKTFISTGSANTAIGTDALPVALPDGIIDLGPDSKHIIVDGFLVRKEE